MSKTVLSTADGTLDWADAREGDFVRVNDQRHKVLTCGAYPTAVVMHSDENGSEYPLVYLELMGAHLERDVEEHPHGLIPTEVGSVIRLGNGDVAVKVDGSNVPWTVQEEWRASGSVQDLADQYGFEEMVPESKAFELGRRAGVRAASQYLSGNAWPAAGAQVQEAFPEAFEEADDE